MQVEAREMVEVLGLPSDPRQRPLGKEFALLDRYVLVDSLADTMAGTKYRYRVQSLLTCHRSFKGRTCRNGHKWARATKSCGLRICPHCCRQRATEVAQKLEPFLRSRPENSLRFMVLTDRNCADLDEGRASVRSKVSAPRRWRDSRSAWAASSCKWSCAARSADAATFGGGPAVDSSHAPTAL